MREKKLCIAIDGPAGAGKSTVARLVAHKLGYIYIDTGAMYRTVALAVIRKGLMPEEDEQIGKLASHLNIRLEMDKGKLRVFLNEEEVTEKIRTAEVAARVSSVAAIRQVREILVLKQRDMARDGGVVMDGRDIGTHVLPDAEVKIYMTASVEERARRRYEERKDKEPSISLEQIARDIAARDEMDHNRTISPLIAADDAYILDTTQLSIDQVVEKIVSRCQAVQQGECLK